MKIEEVELDPWLSSLACDEQTIENPVQLLA